MTGPGFKTASHPDFDLPAGARLELNIKLEVGAVSEAVTVSGEPPLLNADNTSTGLVVDQQNVMDLPFPGGNAMILTWMAPSAQSARTISDSSQGLHSGGPGNSVGVSGRVGGNDSYIDGASNNANNRGSGFNPAPEFVQAVRVETSGFDASVSAVGCARGLAAGVEPPTWGRGQRAGTASGLRTARSRKLRRRGPRSASLRRGCEHRLSCYRTT